MILKNSEHVATPRLWDWWFLHATHGVSGTSALLALQLHLGSHGLQALSAHLIQLAAAALLRGLCLSLASDFTASQGD